MHCKYMCATKIVLDVVDGLYLELNLGGSGTSKSIPLRLWYLDGLTLCLSVYYTFLFTNYRL